MGQVVYVVTDSELGWDCVVAVYDNEVAAQACAEARGETAYVDSQTLEYVYVD